MDLYGDRPRPAVRVHKPRQSEANLNPGVDIEITGEFDEHVSLHVKNGEAGLTLSLRGADGMGSVVLLYLHGRLDLDDARDSREVS